MGERPGFVVGAVVVALVAAACTSESRPASAIESDAEAPAVPNPPPRYASSTSAPVDAGEGTLVGEPGLVIKCGGREPFLCVVDGTPVCSDRPCLPDCTRVGCVGSDVCTACDGGWVCRAPGDPC